MRPTTSTAIDAGRMRTIVLQTLDDGPDGGGRQRPLAEIAEDPTRGLDPELVLFLYDRLREEVLSATRRRETAAPDQVGQAERGLRLLDELVLDIKYGRALDRTSLRLLAAAYGRHPDFRTHWASVAS